MEKNLMISTKQSNCSSASFSAQMFCRSATLHYHLLPCESVLCLRYSLWQTLFHNQGLDLTKSSCDNKLPKIPFRTGWYTSEPTKGTITCADTVSIEMCSKGRDKIELDGEVGLKLVGNLNHVYSDVYFLVSIGALKQMNRHDHLC